MSITHISHPSFFFVSFLYFHSPGASFFFVINIMGLAQQIRMVDFFFSRYLNRTRLDKYKKVLSKHGFVYLGASVCLCMCQRLANIFCCWINEWNECKHKHNNILLNMQNSSRFNEDRYGALRSRWFPTKANEVLFCQLKRVLCITCTIPKCISIIHSRFVCAEEYTATYRNCIASFTSCIGACIVRV